MQGRLWICLTFKSSLSSCCHFQHSMVSTISFSGCERPFPSHPETIDLLQVLYGQHQAAERRCRQHHGRAILS